MCFTEQKASNSAHMYTSTERLTNLCPQHDSCRRSLIAYEACTYRQFVVLFLLQFNSPYFTEGFRNVDLKLLSWPRTFGKYFSTQDRNLFLELCLSSLLILRTFQFFQREWLM